MELPYKPSKDSSYDKNSKREEYIIKELYNLINKALNTNESLRKGYWIDEISLKLQKEMKEESLLVAKLLSENPYVIG